MRKAGVLLIVLVLLLFITTAAIAALYDRGGGLIYDDVLDITWMQNANYTGNTMTWDDSIIWVDNFVFQGYDDWRLPSTDISCSGYDCIGSEMGHLFYNDSVTSTMPGLFTDVRPYMYWSDTVYDIDPSKAWRFNFSTGYQGTSSKTTTMRYAWAVRNGDSTPPVVPEPISSILFVIGAATLSFRKLWEQV